MSGRTLVVVLLLPSCLGQRRHCDLRVVLDPRYPSSSSTSMQVRPPPRSCGPLGPKMPTLSHRMQNALTDVKDGGRICLAAEWNGPIHLDRLPLRIPRFVEITADPASAFRPVFDCQRRSNFLTADLAMEGNASVVLSGLAMQHCCAAIGGGLSLRAPQVSLIGLRFKDTHSTRSLLECSDVSQSPVPEGCFVGGGAVFVQARRVAMHDVVATDCTSSLSGGAIAVLDTAEVLIDRVQVQRTSAHWYGGGVAVLATGNESTANARGGGAVENLVAFDRTSGRVVRTSWTVRASTFGNVSSDAGGGAVAFVSNYTVRHGDWRIAALSVKGAVSRSGGAVLLMSHEDAHDTRWSLSNITTFNTATTSLSGGSVALWANRDVHATDWASESQAASHGGALNIGAAGSVHNSIWLVRSVEVHRSKAVNDSGGAVAVEVLGAFNGSKLEISQLVATDTSAKEDGGAIFLTLAS